MGINQTDESGGAVAPEVGLVALDVTIVSREIDPNVHHVVRREWRED
jgi:hypothetical protein